MELLKNVRWSCKRTLGARFWLAANSTISKDWRSFWIFYLMFVAHMQSDWGGKFIITSTYSWLHSKNAIHTISPWYIEFKEIIYNPSYNQLYIVCVKKASNSDLSLARQDSASKEVESCERAYPANEVQLSCHAATEESITMSQSNYDYKTAFIAYRSRW